MAQLHDGQPFGRFQIVSRLGRGGMASVYRAYEHALDRTVALKVLPEELLDNPDFAERFAREARIIAKLEHPNVVPLYASGIDEGHPWMALRLVKGGQLGERMAGGRLGLEEGLAYFSAIAEALDFAHAEGVVHRDLKPQNVLLGERGECYVADFGVASLLEGNTRLTQAGATLGTPQYMAPEQAKAEAVGPAADIYALGIMVYQWQSGMLPFDADTPYAVMFKHVGTPLPLEPLAHLPERMRQVIARALAKSPADRWPTATAFVRALREASAASAHAGPRPAAHASRAAEHRARGTKGARVAAAAVVLALAAWAAWTWRAHDVGEPIAVERESREPAGEADRIAAIQRELDALGYRVERSGTLDEGTVSAIIAFQRDHALPATGAVDDALAVALVAERDRRDDAAWSLAIEGGNGQSYRAYLDTQALGRHRGEAEAAIATAARIDEAVRRCAAAVPQPPPAMAQRFVNDSGGPIAVLWVRPDTLERRPYFDLAAGESRTQQTFKGHYWIARAPDGSVRGEVCVADADAALTITRVPST